MRDLLHPALFVLIVVAIGVVAHVALRRLRTRLDDEDRAASRRPED